MPETALSGQHELVEFLRAAREDSGRPSLRTISAGTDYSHTTIAKALNPAGPPQAWTVVEQIARAVGADVPMARTLWMRATGADEEEAVPVAELSLGDFSVEKFSVEKFSVEELSAEEHSAEFEVPGVVPRSRRRSRGAYFRRMSLSMTVVGMFIGVVVIGVLQTFTSRLPLATDLVRLVEVVALCCAMGCFGFRVRTAHCRGRSMDRAYQVTLLAGTVLLAVGVCGGWVQSGAATSGDITSRTCSLACVGALILFGCAMCLRAYGGGDRTLRWMIGFGSLTMGSAAFATSSVLLGFAVGGIDATSGVLLHMVLAILNIVLVVLSALPMLEGRRLVGSSVLVAAFSVAAVSECAAIVFLTTAGDTGMPVGGTTDIPPSVQLGSVAFVLGLAVWSAIARPMVATSGQSGRWPHCGLVELAGVLSSTGAVIVSAVVLFMSPVMTLRISVLMCVGLASAGFVLVSLGLIYRPRVGTKRKPAE